MHFRRLSLSILLTVLVEIFNKIYPLIIFRFVIDRIGYEAFGTAQFGISLVEMSVPFITFGYHDYASIRVGQSKDRDGEIQQVFTHTLLLKLVHAFCLSLFILGAFNLDLGIARYQMLVLALSFTILGNALDASWMNIGLQKIPLMSIIIVLSKVVSLLGIVFYIEQADDGILYAVLHCCANTIVNFATFAIFVRKYPLVVPKSFALVKQAFIKTLPFASIAILNILFIRVDWLMVQSLFADVGTGYYAGPVRINNAVYSFLTAIGMVFFSEALLCKDKEQVSKHYHSALFVLSFLLVPFLVFCLFFEQDILSLLLGEVRGEQYGLLFIQATGNIGAVGITLYGLQILATKAETKKIILSLTLGLFMSVVLFLLCKSIPSLRSLWGVSFAMLCGKLLSASILAYFSRPYLEQIIYSSCLRNIAAGGLVGLIAYFLSFPLDGYHFLLQVCFLGSCYVCICFVVNQKILLNLYHKVRDKAS
ncbi:MAG: oligosaccharide flippase family protein [Oligoflexales bacterium]